jgi:hypothetical protein
MEAKSRAYLQKSNSNSFKAFFYFGIAMYKQLKFEMAILAFLKAEQINQNDA